MSKLKDYDLYFIHIPKNGGTSFEKQFCGVHKGHLPITKSPKKIWNKTIAIVRNPYDRIISIYNYSKMEKSYWHSKDGSTKYSINPLYKYCSTHSFEQFVKDLCKDKFNHVIHVKPQNYWVLTNEGKIVSKIVKLENINSELSHILGKEVNMIKINTSDNSNYENYYTEETLELIYNKYKKDFILFDYSKYFQK